jgi:IS1 family transposase
MKDQFAPEDLNQITQESLERLRKSDVIQLALRLRDFGIDLYERQNLDSSNSSKPPSSDNPYQKNKTKTDGDDDSEQSSDQAQDHTDELDDGETSEGKIDPADSDDQPKRKPGRQPGSEGFWRKEKPDAKNIEHHYPKKCMICLKSLDEFAQPYMGHYTYELERRPDGIRILCTLHYYYTAVCVCGHENIEKPGEGYVSILEGRKRNIRLTEYTIVGPMLATFISALSRRCGMSRKKIQEHLRTWLNFYLSVGLICRSIREAGIACYPVVDELIDDLQKEEKVHLDETPWYQKGAFCWLWVAISKSTAIYRIGTRKKTELLHLITEAFLGWLITDGYGAYRSYPKRQRCLAHLIRKAIALTGAVSKEAQKKGEWFLREMRGLIKAMAEGEDGRKECRPILARLKRACNLGSKSDHDKLKSLANEILNDWDAVVAFVKNPGLPATNNEAERALRWAVIFRKITFGTRTSEGSRSYAAQISVIETCRLRNVDPWNYIAMTIAKGRKGLAPPPIA